MRFQIPIRRPAAARTSASLGPLRVGRRHGAHAIGRTARSRRTVRGGRRLLGLLGTAISVTFLSAGSALAYWASTDSSHPAAAAAATLSAPTGGAQTGTGTPSSIAISWTAPSGYTPTSYTVDRCTGSSCTPVTAIASGGCSGTVSGTSCTDNDPALAPGTTYSYAVTASLHNWASPASTTFHGSTTGASNLVFTTQPSTGANIQATGTGSFAVSVAVQDSQGNTVTSDNTDTVTLAINNNPSSGVLTCTNVGGLTVTVSAGVADFTGCAITKVGTGYTLTASSSTSPSLAAPGNAHAFNITAGTASQLVFTTTAVVGTASSSATLGPITVQQQDADGNPVDAGVGGVAVGLASNSTGVHEFSGSSGGSSVTSVTISPGSSTANFFYGDELAGRPTITVSAAGVTSGTQLETINAGPAAGMSFSNVSTTNGASTATCAGTVGTASFVCTVAPQSGFISMSADVTLIDQFQNVVTNSGSAITVSLSQSGGVAVLPATLTIPNGSSTSSGSFTETLVSILTPATVTATATVNSASVEAKLTS